MAANLINESLVTTVEVLTNVCVPVTIKLPAIVKSVEIVCTGPTFVVVFERRTVLSVLNITLAPLPLALTCVVIPLLFKKVRVCPPAKAVETELFATYVEVEIA